MEDGNTWLGLERGQLHIRRWPTTMRPPPGCCADGDELRAPPGHRGRVRRMLLAAGLPFVDSAEAEPARAPTPPSPLPAASPPGLSTWLRLGGAGIAAGLPTAHQIDLTLAAMAATGAPTGIVVRDTGAAALWTAALRERGAAADVVTAAEAARRPGGRSPWCQLLVIVQPELLPPPQLDAILQNTPAGHHLGLLDDAHEPRLLTWSNTIGPLLLALSPSPLAERCCLHLPLSPSDRADYEVAWHTFLCGFDAFAALRQNAGFGTFIQQARQDPAWRPSLLAWHRAQRIAAWNNAKRHACAELLERHRRERVLVFTPDRASAYQLAQQHLIAPITAELTRREREQLLGDFRAGRLRCLCGPRLLDLGVPESCADVGISVGGGFGVRHRLAQLRRIRRGGRIYELLAAQTLEVGRARRLTQTASTSAALHRDGR